ncbi:hypothetical protein Taro_014082 [Colocasia esculenta]|uniref:Zinc finger CCCH domain-containing protein 1 n=1 Tax=Colocasia esculenta TaxID=4460 RepID=A0A843UDY0_COLES|nr:hypothetical protein [Colocasia esculenta]
MAEDAAASEPPDSGNPPVCNFIRKPPKGRNIRKRRSGSADAEDDGDEKQPQASSLLQRPKKTLVHDNKLHFSTAAGSSSRSRQTAAAAEDEEEAAESASAAFHFESSKEIQVQNDSRATATLETETEFTRDARAIRERTLKLAEENLKGKARTSGDEKLYRGIHGYTDHKAGFRREQTVSGEKAGGAHGPLRAPVHIRVSARFDYQPDICKDYKETGYCGYGDACKFMHDRGDYKMGWQLEREWEESEKARKRALAMGGGEDGDDGIGGGDDDDDDDLPFACFICRQPFEDPVVTKCKHYFCEHCALKHYQKNKKCFVCNKPTLGIFNTAHEIKKKMAEMAETK